ncbi:hypothetical protein AB3S75_019901 [Citrus x aurantiifolia]
MLATVDPPENNYPFRRETNKSHHANTYYLYRECVRHTQGILKLQVIKIAFATSENTNYFTELINSDAIGVLMQGIMRIPPIQVQKISKGLSSGTGALFGALQWQTNIESSKNNSQNCKKYFANEEM